MPLMTVFDPPYKIAPAGLKWVIMARVDVPWYEHLFFVKPKFKYVKFDKSKYRTVENAQQALKVAITARGGMVSEKRVVLPRYFDERGQEVALARSAY